MPSSPASPLTQEGAFVCLSLRPASLLPPLLQGQAHNRSSAPGRLSHLSTPKTPLLEPVPFAHQVLADLYRLKQGAYTCLHLLPSTLFSSSPPSCSLPPNLPNRRNSLKFHKCAGSDLPSLLGAMVTIEGQSGIGEVGPRGHWSI